MSSLEYRKELLNDLWKQRRIEIIRRDNRECQLCLSKKNLEVHHKKYITGRKAWEYEDRYLITLCQTCHTKHHRELKSKKPKSKKPKFNFSKNDARHQYYQNLKEGAIRHGI